VSCAEISHSIRTASLTLFLWTFVYFYFCPYLILHYHCANFDSAHHSLLALLTLPFHPPFPLLHYSTITFLHLCHIPTSFFPVPCSPHLHLMLPLRALTHPPNLHHILNLYTSSPSTPSLTLYPLHPPSPYSHNMSSLILHYPLPHALPGIVKSHTECVELVSQKLGGKVLFKRELTVYDQSNTEVRLTLWGDKGNSSFPFSLWPIFISSFLPFFFSSFLLFYSSSFLFFFSSSLPLFASSSLLLFFSLLIF
jgi:Replication protein A OB domain